MNNKDPVKISKMEDCDVQYSMVNASYLESFSKPLYNMTIDQLHELQKMLKATQLDYCDGWLKNAAKAYAGAHG